MEEMRYLGTVSGKEEDKIQKSGLTLTHLEGVPCFEEATAVLICRKLYRQPMQENYFLDKSIVETSYPQKDFHDVYVGEVEKIFVRS